MKFNKRKVGNKMAYNKNAASAKSISTHKQRKGEKYMYIIYIYIYIYIYTYIHTHIHIHIHLHTHTHIYLTIIPRTRVGYELLDSGQGGEHRVGYHKLISNKCEWNNCFIKYQTLDKIS